MSYGAWVLGFGISLGQAMLVVALGVVASFAICGVIALGAMAGYHIIMKLQSVLTWITGLTTIVYITIGWGFVVNGFAEEAAWNNWQGYLLFLLRGRQGVWAEGNIGVIISLALGFVGYLALCRGRVRAQEPR